LNKIEGDWDEEKLEALLSELKENNFDTNIIGYSQEEYEELLENLSVDNGNTVVEDDDFDVSEALSQISEPETKYGE
ncbi:hypothetical protein R0J87_25250, partial [Halomonas sp. SIMBA_159]